MRQRLLAVVTNSGVWVSNMSKASQVWTSVQWRIHAPFKGSSFCSSLANHYHVAIWVQGCQINFFRDARNPKFVCEIPRFLILAPGSVVKYNCVSQAKPSNVCGLYLIPGLTVLVVYSKAVEIDLTWRLVQFSLWQESPALGIGKLFLLQCSCLFHFVEYSFQFISLLRSKEWGDECDTNVLDGSGW